MKITKRQLRKLIKEELGRVISEMPIKGLPPEVIDRVTGVDKVKDFESQSMGPEVHQLFMMVKQLNKRVKMLEGLVASLQGRP